MSVPRKTVEIKTLPVELNDEEWGAKSGELARVVMEEKEHEAAIEAYKDNTKSAVKAMEARLASMRGNRNALAQAVSTRRVSKDVPCDWFYHLDSGKAVLVRRDTGEAVESRDLKPEEKQLAIGEKLQEATAGQISIWEQQLAEAQVEALVESDKPVEEDEAEELPE